MMFVCLYFKNKDADGQFLAASSKSAFGQFHEEMDKVKKWKFHLTSKVQVLQPQMWYQLKENYKIFHMSGVLMRLDSGYTLAKIVFILHYFWHVSIC